jgi:transposase InsO family protein
MRGGNDAVIHEGDQTCKVCVNSHALVGGDDDGIGAGISSRDRLVRESRQRTEATSAARLKLHLPFNPFCESCVFGKKMSQPARRRDPARIGQALKFGDKVGVDHMIISSKGDIGLGGERAALHTIDFATGFKTFGALQGKLSLDAEVELRNAFGTDEIREINSDRSPELRRAARSLGIVQSQSAPYRSTANSKTERHLGITVFGTRSSLHTAGFPHK